MIKAIEYPKELVEDCVALDINYFVKKRLLVSDSCKGKFTWEHPYTPSEQCSVQIEISSDQRGRYLALYYRFKESNKDWENRKQVIRLQTTLPHFGGIRWWFTCPQCHRRVGNLFFPPSGQHFACRLCWRLAYRSQREAPWLSSIAKADAIAGRLGTKGKPKRMHWKTYYRLKMEWLAQRKKANDQLQRHLGISST